MCQRVMWGGMLALCLFGACRVAADVVLFDAATTDRAAIASQNGAAFTVTNGLLTVTTKPSNDYPGVKIAGTWDLSACTAIDVDFVDAGINGRFTVRLQNADGVPPHKGCYIAKAPMFNPAKSGVRTCPFPTWLANWQAITAKLTRVRTWALPYLLGEPVPEQGLFAWSPKPQSEVKVMKLDPAHVREVAVYINTPKLPHVWSIRRIVAKMGTDPAAKGTGPTAKKGTGPSVPAFARMSVKEFFPCIDVYGQFKHREWPDKVHTDADLKAQREKEAQDLAAHPGPSGWDKWGGWAKGPQFPATGGFTVTKWQGKWWFVDPDGHLWWSHGPVRVTPSCATTALDGHLDWFENLPAKGAADAEFYSTRDQLLFPYYARWKMKDIYDFSARNIAHKYGSDWYQVWSDLAHRRLRSWGCNTIANSSDAAICRMDRTPYTERLEVHARPIAGHKGGWWDFCDPFDPSFRAELRRQLEIHRAFVQDPWCFGIFVDNEHFWGNETTFAVSTLKSPADQPCKRVFRDRLQAKYKTVEALNRAWHTDYRDWDAFLLSQKVPDVKNARGDLVPFAQEVTEAYFRTVREELNKAVPGKLYMGCRWAGSAPEYVVRASAKFCDVLSYNIYRRNLRTFSLPKGVDKPVIVGEFHFGALDRGPFCPGLLLLRDQNDRARVYEEYVRSALEHPQVVGVHWHQFSDESTAGRFDGENMQVGWTDVCDTPYWETISSVRKMGDCLYEVRAGRSKSVVDGGVR